MCVFFLTYLIQRADRHGDVKTQLQGLRRAVWFFLLALLYSVLKIAFLSLFISPLTAVLVDGVALITVRRWIETLASSALLGLCYATVLSRFPQMKHTSRRAKKKDWVLEHRMSPARHWNVMCCCCCDYYYYYLFFLMLSCASFLKFHLGSLCRERSRALAAD